MKMEREELITELRAYYLIPSKYSDDQVIDLTKGSFGRAIIELRFAKSNFCKAIKASLPRWVKLMLSWE
jgi:hypothetical protein